MPAHDNELINELEILAAILAKYGNGGQSGFIESLIELKKISNPDFENKLASSEVWGGSGAVWEVPNFKKDWMSHSRAEEADSDELRFREAIKYLVAYINDNQIGSDDIRERARFIADTFNYWTRKRL